MTIGAAIEGGEVEIVVLVGGGGVQGRAEGLGVLGGGGGGGGQ